MSTKMIKKHLVYHNASLEDGISLVSNSPGTVSDEIAFVFDIDGVLMKGGKAVPEGIEALKYLNGDNPYGNKVYAFFFYLTISFSKLSWADFFLLLWTLHLRNQLRRQDRRRTMSGSQSTTAIRYLPWPVHMRPHPHA